MANGYPMEGSEAPFQRAGNLARLDAPTCNLLERVGEVRKRVQEAGWDTCVVVNTERVVLGLLRSDGLEVDPHLTVEEAMESGTRTYRLDAPLEKPDKYMEKMGFDSVVVTTSDGRLHGLLEREAIKEALVSE